ncbi:hypothetical protein HPB52_006608 [Rhipicephalus sanguineus]|uniref:FMN hydroxy acid dehydrogenase domain-containing protein n=1 Tax=Rhipicephalus sanguineus TaxID=34632 RepID=A0A9D4QDB2_RHISA|nr:hypothetical protein HPB52_006608 [Rhipicephalus sanguineus]
MAVVSVEDIQHLGEAKLEEHPRTYIALGAGHGHTLRENTEAFKRILFRPRIFLDVERVNTSTTVLGCAVSFPVGLAPSAGHKMAHPDGEIASVKGKSLNPAQDAGTVMILSSLSTVSLEDVRAAAPGCLLWQQTCIYRDRTITQSLVERAAASGFSAIVVTADAPVHGDGKLHHPYMGVSPPSFR